MTAYGRTAVRNNTKIRSVVFAFLLFEFAMLFQTSYLHLGTIVAAAIVGLIVITYFLNKPKFHFVTCSLVLVIYALMLFLCSVFTFSLTSKLFQVILYIALFVILSSIDLNENEKKLLIHGYVFSSIVYSALIIYSKFELSSDYVHSKIVLFGTVLDPNYVGLPLIVSFSIVLFDLINSAFDKKKIIAVFEALVLAFTILLTSSRGNFVGVVICVLGNIIYFINKRKLVWYKKFALFLIIVAFFVGFYYFAKNNYSGFLDRILHYKSDDISNGRFELWEKAIALWLEHPIFGYGYESLGRTYGIGVHNTFIQLLCDTGLIGFIIFAFFLLIIGKRCFSNNKNLFIAFIGLLAHSFFLGAISSRCFWVTLIMIGLVLPKHSTNNFEFF